MIEVFKEFTFEAAHRIAPYSGVHGHSFCVEIVLRGCSDPEFGWVTSLSEVEPRVQEVQKALDHKFLNELDGLDVPSLENVARWIWHRLDFPELHRIMVRRGHVGHGEGCTLYAPIEA